MINISDVAVTRVIHAAKRGDDPLQIGSGHKPMDQRDRAKKLCLEALDGLDQHAAIRVAESLQDMMTSGKMGGNPDGIMPLDPLMARVLANEGIDPLTAIWIAVQIGPLELDNEKTGRIAGTVDGTSPADDMLNTTMCILSGKARWTQHGNLVLYDIPETVGHAAVGRPLGAVISHGVLDAAGLSVIGVEESFNGRGMIFKTDHVVRPAEISELMNAAPFGCR